MRELEIARSKIRRHPDGDVERTLHEVIAALETSSPMDTASIYALDYDDFNLVIELMRGWRLQRHTAVARNRLVYGATFFEKRRSPSNTAHSAQ